MGRGLEVFGPTGGLVLATSDGIGRFTGFSDVGGSYTGTPYTGSIVVPGYSAGQRVWYNAFIQWGHNAPPSGGYLQGSFTLSGGTLSYEVWVNTRIQYGLY